MQNNNEIFKTLFGIFPSQLKKTCIVIPFYSKDIISILNIKNISRGLLYSAGNDENITLIITRMGSAFTGDAVLYLKDTPCEKIIFFGSCGAVDKGQTKIGGIFLIKKAYSQDSFTNTLSGKEINDTFASDNALTEKLLSHSDGMHKGNCLTVSSLKLEEKYLKSLDINDIDVIDMETSAVLAAAQNIGKKAAAALFVTDIIGTKPYYEAFSKENSTKMRQIVQKSSKTLLKLIDDFQL
ncbi:hypothetical protein ACFL58_01640 [Elusimicrobiota bacterium]